MLTPQKRRPGERSFSVGTFIVEVPLLSTVRIAAAAGADFVIFDGEHGTIELEALRSAVAMCRALGLEALVRVPCVSTPWIARALDSGARGILAPNVETAAEAAALVEQAYFPPKGRRGASFNSSQDDYSAGSIAAKIDEANDNIIILCMIESPRGARNVAEIVSTPGIAGCWFGYIDFSIAAGLPGQLDHPDVMQAASRVADACKSHSKVAGVMTTSEEHLSSYLSRGYDVVAWGSDAFVLKQGLTQGMHQCREILSKANKQRSQK